MTLQQYEFKVAFNIMRYVTLLYFTRWILALVSPTQISHRDVAFDLLYFYSNMFIAIQILFSENNDGLPKDKIYDLFQMLGYTFQQHDLDE